VTPLDPSAGAREAWHRLLAPLPADAVPERKPVAPPEVLALPEGRAIAGWESVTLMLTDAAVGLRHLHVVLDETGRPISAGDHVFYRATSDDGPAQIRQESIGGRLEPDGRFLGTCWLVTGPEPADDGPPQWEMTPRTPTEPEVTALKGLVADLVGRLP
jgi:hypothetical protein